MIGRFPILYIAEADAEDAAERRADAMRDEA